MTNAGHALPGHALGPANRLAAEASPYLLQHAHNPVDWWPWGAAAIAEARRRDVPLFVSVGYSTCYWCHVMARESFESAAASALLNETCVPVKVDREERPDVDEVLMTACQVYTQLTEGRPSGGWPLHAFLDPQTLEPFFCGTYFPPEPGFGRPSFSELLGAVRRAWTTDRAGMRDQAHRIAGIVRAQGRSGEPRVLDAMQLSDDVADAMLRLADPTNGGFGGAPKFPTPAYPRFLAATRAGNPGVDALLKHMLDRMACGGIFDQAGGGFHRYAVDATWTVPHFEKMLYDNGQLASLYAWSAARTGDAFHAEVTRRTCDWMLREMTGEDGRFLAAQDAEVDAREGANYVWTPDQVRAALDAAGAAELWPFAARLYGLHAGANFQDPHHPNDPPVWVLRLSDRPDALAVRDGMPFAVWQSERARVDAVLLAARAARPQPATDDKTIAAWSGLAAEGLADAGRVLREPRFVAAAAAGVRFCDRRMRTADGTLLRAWRAGAGHVPAFLEDEAHLANACLALWRAAGDAAWLADARRFVDAAIARFLQPDGTFLDAAPGPELFAPVRGLDDGAMPSATAAITRAMAALAAATGDAALADRARTALAGVSAAIAEQPVAASGSVLVLRDLAGAADAVQRS